MRRILLFSAPLVLMAALFGVFATQIGRDTRLVPSVFINKSAPEFALTAVPGIDRPGFETADLSGQVAVVNVFASWCVPCRDEHPLLIALKNRFPDVALFGINQKDQPDQAVQFLQELGNPYDFVGADSSGRVSIDLGVTGVPETFVLNADGIITFKHVGPIDPQSFEELVAPAIEAAQSGPGQS